MPDKDERSVRKNAPTSYREGRKIGGSKPGLPVSSLS